MTRRQQQRTLWRFVPALAAGAFITVLTTGSRFFDDSIPPPGTAIRGLPLPFLLRRSLDGSDRQWRIRWRIAALDVLFWSALSYFVGYAIAHPFAPRPGRCRNCGYNLTGNTSGVCPECGTALPMHIRTSP